MLMLYMYIDYHELRFVRVTCLHFRLFEQVWNSKDIRNYTTIFKVITFTWIAFAISISQSNAILQKRREHSCQHAIYQLMFNIFEAYIISSIVLWRSFTVHFIKMKTLIVVRSSFLVISTSNSKLTCNY